MDRKKIIIPIVGLALSIKNAGDLCAQNLDSDTNIKIKEPQTANIFCQINSSNPEHPETQHPYHPLTFLNYSVSASAASLSTVPYQSIFKLK